MFRKNRSKIWIDILLLISTILLIIVPVQSRAQNDISFSFIEIDLWPEFDQPTMLVIYRLTLKPTVSFPAEIHFRIPSQAGRPNAVAGRQPDGVLINVPYEQEAEGIWNWIIFQATTPDIQIEYYDPKLVKDGVTRHYEYTWLGDYPVDSLVVEIQQPSGAYEMQIKPGLVEEELGSDGLTYYQINVGSLYEHQQFRISINYEKQNDRLSFDNLPVVPSGPLDETTAGRMQIHSALPVGLGLLGIILLVGGVLWYWRSGQKPISFKSKVKAHRSQRQTSEEAEILQHIYCHRCGKRATPGDRFCRTCGTKLRV
jgi:ribosomal protein L40E